jgi:TonB family protein
MEKDKKKTKFIHQPEYPGGPKELTKFLYEHLRYPQLAVQAGIEGTVFVEYDIDYQGNVTATRVLQGIGHGCDEEACRVIRMFKFDVPKNRGINVLFHQKIRVKFAKPQPVPAPQPTTQVTYTIVPAEKPAESIEVPSSGSNMTYSYTITI